MKFPENPYDLLPIILAKEEIMARPVEFIMGKLDPESATKYQTTCPKCSQLVEFAPKDVFEKDNKFYVSGCNECPFPMGAYTQAKPGATCSVPQACPAPVAAPTKLFIDPIANKLMILEGAVLVNV